MPPNLIARCLHVVLAVVLAASGGIRLSEAAFFGFREQAERPRQHPDPRARDAAGVESGQLKVAAKERAVEQLHRAPDRRTTVTRSRTDGDHHAAGNPLPRLHRLQDGIDRVFVAAGQQDLELRVPQDGIQFGRQANVHVPDGRWKWPAVRCGHIREPAGRILCGERFQDQPPQVVRESQEQPHLPAVVPVLKLDRFAPRSRLVDRREDLLHVPRPAFVIGRCADCDEHEGRISEM